MSNQATSIGGDAMQIEFEKTRVNVWHIGSLAALLVTTAFGWGVLYNKMETNDVTAKSSIAELKEQIQGEAQARSNRSMQTDGRFKAIEDKIPQFEVVALQIQRLTELSAQNEKSIQATNERINRVVESQSGKLDAIISRLSDLSSSVAVLQSQLDNQKGTTQRTRFPIMRAK